MGRIVSIIQFTGRAGSVVGSKGKGGKVLLRQYQPTVANPRTAAQMAQRAKLKLAAQVAGMLGEVGRTSLVANGNRKTDRGLLIKQLLKSVLVNQDGTKASLGYDLNLIDNPSYNRTLSLSVSSSENAYVAAYSGAEEGEVIAKCILVHDLKTGLWRHASAMDTNDTISIGKSKNEDGNPLEVFAYGIVLMPKTSEGFNNISPTGADDLGYVVDLNKVSTVNYDFSPCVSAAMKVESDGTSETPAEQTPSGGNGGSSTPSGGSSTPSGSDNNQASETTSVAAPEISGTVAFTDTTEVTITAAEGAEIRYTVDGTDPSANSTLYSESFTLSDSATVKAIAILNGEFSSVASKTFTKGTYGDTN